MTSAQTSQGTKDPENATASKGELRRAKAEQSYGYEEGILHDLGEIAKFFVRAVRVMPKAWGYPSEVLRQNFNI